MRTLTAEGESTWSDADGDTISYTYQWFKYNPAAQEFEAISGATGEAYNGTLTKGEQYQVRSPAPQTVPRLPTRRMH